MSSKKDLLDRMQQQQQPKQAATVIKRRPSEAPIDPSKETETRVGDGKVIRRRTEAPAPPPLPARGGFGGSSRGAPPPPATPAPQRTILRKAEPEPSAAARPLPTLATPPAPDPVEKAAPVEAAPTQSAPAQSAPVEAAPPQSASAQSTPVQSTPAQSESVSAVVGAPVEAVQAVRAPVSSPAEARPSAAPPQAETRTEAPEPSAPSRPAERTPPDRPTADRAMVVERAQVVRPADRPTADRAMVVERGPGRPTADRAMVVERGPGRPNDRGPQGPRPGDRGPAPRDGQRPGGHERGDRAQVVERAPHRPAQDRPTLDTSPPRGDDGPRLPSLGRAVVRPPEASASPRAEEGPRLPGLGRAVVRPPPGYDPTDPSWNQRRAPAAPAPAEAARPASPRGGMTDDDIREAARKAGVPMGGDDGDRRRGRNKRRGRVEALMEGIPGKARRKRPKKGMPKIASPKPKAQKRKVQIDNTVSVGHLAKEMGVRSAEVIKKLMGMGVMATINDQVDIDTAQLVAVEFDYEVVNVGFTEEKVLIEQPKEEGNAVKRPPVVTVMGHVDHGKTTLLDTIRKAKVAAGEAGGITQHIGAYQVKRGKELVTFIDTPGHAAFTEMRARGALATDVVILVVAADDGVMPQTVESINHTKAAKVPIVVAVNKVDKPGVKPELIRQKLMEHGLVPEEYGGDTLMVDVSALKGTGIDDLLDAVLLVAELMDLKADPDRHGEGLVLESKLETGRGSVATVLVKKGTLKQGDPVVVGTTWGKVRAMTDSVGKRVKSAGPSTPVEIIGLEVPPSPGDSVVVVTSEKDARTLAEHRAEAIRHEAAAQRQRVTLQDLYKTQGESEIKKLNLVLKADVQGSVEALRSAVAGIKVEGTEVSILHSAVGAVSESDITLASTYDAVVFGFNVRPDANARRAAEEKGVEVRTYRIIYELLDDVKKGLTGMLKPVLQEKVQGHATVRQVFSIPKVGTIAGCFVTDGKIVRSHTARLLRDGVVVWEGKLGSLRRFKDDVREVEKGYECGISLDGFQDVKERDEIETFTIEAVAPI